MKYINNILRILIFGLILNILLIFCKAFKNIFIELLKVLWIFIKYLVKFAFVFLYYMSRLLTLPFRNCFPNKNLNQMSGLDFEDFVAKWLILEGYRGVQKTPITNDYGIDLVARKDNVRVGVQCKRYSDKVGVGAIQEVSAGLPVYECDRGIVITNSSFTENAKELAISNGVELIDGSDLENAHSSKSLIKSTGSIIFSLIILFLFAVFALILSGYFFMNYKAFLPLSLMLLGICILSFINGYLEVKDRKSV